MYMYSIMGMVFFGMCICNINILPNLGPLFNLPLSSAGGQLMSIIFSPKFSEVKFPWTAHIETQWMAHSQVHATVPSSNSITQYCIL